MAHDEHHIVPTKTYFKVFGALVFLTLLTVVAAPPVTGVNLGMFTAAIAFAIAATKGALVLAYFMHLKYEGYINQVIFGSGLFFLLVFIFFVAVDLMTRYPIEPFPK